MQVVHTQASSPQTPHRRVLWGNGNAGRQPVGIRLRCLQQQVSEEAVSLPIYVPTYTMATKGIEGLRFDAEGYPVFYDVQLSAGN